MLTSAQRRYVEICMEKISTHKTNEELGRQFGSDRSLVDRALRWGNLHDLFTTDLGRKITLRIAEFDTLLRALEVDFKRAHRKPRKRNPDWKPNYRHICALAREIRETRRIKMELEGIYKQVVSHLHSAPGGGPILYEVVDTPPDNGPSEN